MPEQRASVWDLSYTSHSLPPRGEPENGPRSNRLDRLPLQWDAHFQGSVKQPVELVEVDRQSVWELYVEMATRVAVTGKPGDQGADDFTDELLIESLESLHQFFGEARRLLRALPIGKVKPSPEVGLGALLIQQAILGTVRPFLERWQVNFRLWWQQKSEVHLPPFERQALYPEREAFLADWGRMRARMRAIGRELVTVYELPDLLAPVDGLPAWALPAADE